MINVPLAAGAGSKSFREAVTEAWLPALGRSVVQHLRVLAGLNA